MIVRLIKKSKIYNFNLPEEITGNYWITDTDYLGNSRNLINVQEENGNWKIKSDFETKIMSGENVVESAVLNDYSLYFLKVNTDNEYVILYCSPSKEKSTIRLRPKSEEDFIIGNDSSAKINYSYPLVSKQHARLIYKNKEWVIQDLNSKYGTYVNNISVTSKVLEYGDIVFIMGLKIIIMPEFLIINNISNYVNYDQNSFQIETSPVQTQTEQDNPDEEQIEFFKEDDYFYRAPRFKTKIEDANISIDSPPGKQEEDKTPAIYTIGPMMTMGMMSLTMSYTSLSGVIDGTKDLKSVAPQLVMSFAMLTSMLLWPILNNNYQKAQKKIKEAARQKKYKEYIETKRAQIQSEMAIQRQILIDNYLPLQSTEEIIFKKKRSLWERELDQDDFLTLRLGIGTTELQGKISFPEERFSMEDDNLLQEVYKLGAESRTLENVPIAISFINRNISAIIGTTSNKKPFVDNLILQMLAYHSYEDLKIVILTDESRRNDWDYLKVAPHIWSNNKTERYFATTLDEAKSLSLILEKELQARKYIEKDGQMILNDKDYRHYKPYYIILTDNYKEYREIDILKDVCESKINYGFSLVVLSPRLVNLPNECKTFISIGDKKSGVFENELVSNKQKEFIAEYDLNLNMYQACKILSNIPIDIAKESKTLPTGLTFLEMYNVGMIEQLNILNKWKTSDPIKSLAAPVGVDKSRELFKLDLHEKAHGPHGLIAGMTGSGKSEFIISYILSMAINYHPYEVSFVLIDYKGGGLAGVFENKETGFKLPHLAGTITNLETVEMNRSLASIQSELRKRQRMFNVARDKLNESTIDIYKYQSLYRKGLVDQPISHLFIISDEFAELKDQQPEFMDQLISTARIGRSLGVHLILATQKPAGVVNDQIWSNSRFRVCLKVQDRSDSMDMIKVPDAAELKNAGRFYLQVGYNELFALGQAAWAGAQYYPQEKRKKKVNKSIDIIDNIGNIIKSLENKENELKIDSKGEEITNIVKYIVDEAKKSQIVIDKLWLDKIPNIIYNDDLKKKYSYQKIKNKINPIIGEYDDPDNQKQGLLTLPLSDNGNTIIYGSGGTGKELALSTIIYSLITNYSPEELNLYMLDFGAETLNMFKKAPQVGDVLLSTDQEKISNLFKMINNIIEERKKILVDYNGSFDFYLTHGGKQLPFITVIINNIEAFIETYQDYDELIGQITRDCLKYGVAFILTTNGPNRVRYRTRQNFPQNIVLQFNDPTDYSSVLPNVRRKQPSKIYGRGLVSLDNIYEYQTSYIYKEEKILDYVKVISEKLNNTFKTKAKKVPVLPEVVNKEELLGYLSNLSTIPIGISKETLEPVTVDFNINYSKLIISDDISISKKFINGINSVFQTIENNQLIIMDSHSILDNKLTGNITYDKDMCQVSLNKLKEVYNDKIDKKDNTTTFCTIIGLSSLLTKITPLEKDKLVTMLTESVKLKTIKFIFVDTIEGLKNLSYEAWFKNIEDLSNGIWIGNGISNQFTLKVTTNSRLLREEITDDFGYNIVKGKATLIKLMSDE